MFGLIQNIGKNFYSNWYLFQSIPKVITRILSWLFTFIVIAYFGYAFNLLTLDKSLAFFANFGYWPIYMLLIVWQIGQLLSTINPMKNKKKTL